MSEKQHAPVTCPNDGCDLSGILNFELNAGEDFCPMCKSVLVPAGEEVPADVLPGTAKYTVH
jgi:hypothetical protein